MKKVLLSLLLIVALALSACAPSGQPDTTGYREPYRAVTAIDHAVTEPDERAALSDAEKRAFDRLTQAMLAREEEVTLDAGEERIAFLLDILRESPYYFFVKKADVQGCTVRFDYAYPAAEQAQMQAMMDRELLAIVNADAQPEDNALDTILKLYYAVGHRIVYDTEREDNKELGSPLFDYPADEVYKALRDGKGLCYAFAYVFRYALMQRGIDAFCIYGECRAHDMGHEWVIFCLDGEWYHCDPSWDRASMGYAKLLHFGKTDDERRVDTLAPRAFEEYHESAFPAPECTDERFGIFRGIVRFSYIREHRYYLEDRDGKEYIFDTEDFSLS